MKAKDKLQLLLKGIPLDEIQKLETQIEEEENKPDESGDLEEGSGTFVTKDELTATLEKLVESIQASNIITDSAESNGAAPNVDKGVDVLLKNLTGESGESEETT